MTAIGNKNHGRAFCRDWREKVVKLVIENLASPILAARCRVVVPGYDRRVIVTGHLYATRAVLFQIVVNERGCLVANIRIFIGKKRAVARIMKYKEVTRTY